MALCYNDETEIEKIFKGMKSRKNSVLMSSAVSYRKVVDHRQSNGLCYKQNKFGTEIPCERRF